MSIRRAALWAMSSYYTAFALQFVVSVILARYFIDPADLGLFSVAYAAITLFTFLQDFGVNRYINGERELSDAKIRGAVTVSLVMGLAISIFALGLAWPVSAFYGQAALLQVMLIIGVGTLFTPFATVPQALCQRDLDFRTNGIIELSSAAANALISLWLAWKGWGAIALAWGYFAQQVARSIVAQIRAGGVAPLPLRFEGLRPVFDLGATNSALTVSHLVTTRAPELFIGYAIGNAATGLFARATGLALQLQLLLTGAVGSVFFPGFRQIRDRGDPLGPPYLKVVAVFTAIGWPAMAALAVLAEPAIRLLFGERWLGAAPLLVWIALAQMLFIALPLTSELAILQARKAALVMRNAIAALASVILLVVALPLGPEMVAASRVAHGAIVLILFSRFMQQLLSYSVAAIITAYLRSAIVTLAAITPAVLAKHTGFPAQEVGWTALFALSGAGLSSWLLALYCTQHPALAEMIALTRTAIRRRA